ncbi:MAG: D-ribose pyranase [Candidatus Bipolaricaulia bacterium]
MKKQGILNERVSAVLARLGHTDWLAIADCGLPIPDGVERIDLALVQGIPRFQDVVQAIASELVVEKVILAQETQSHNPDCYRFLTEQFGDVPVEEISHEELKRRLKAVKAVIRTGEATPYANVILQAGVAF